MKQGQSIRALSGKLRICYEPDWCPAKPFSTFRNGTAGRVFTSLTAAINYLTAGDVSHRWTDWK